jgi:hypothetical protein
MTALDLAAVLWLVGGTFAVKLLLRMTIEKRLPRPLFLVAAVVAAVGPAVAMKLQVAQYSAAGVVTAGVTLFWFAMLAARANNAV